MKYFENYLIEKKLISPEYLLKALLQQMETQPQMPRLALELNLLSAEQILKVFHHQAEASTDFATAALSVGCLSEQNKKLLEKEMRSRQTPLAMILIKNGVLNAKDLVQSIDEFISHAKAPSGVSSIPTMKQAEATNSIESSENEPTFSSITKELVGQLEASLSKDKVEEMVNVLHLVKQNAAMPDLVHTFLEDINNNIVSAQKVADSAKAVLLEKMLKQTSMTLKQVLSGQRAEPEYLSAVLIPAVEEALHLCGEIRQAIISKFTEEDFWQKPEARKRFETITEKLIA